MTLTTRILQLLHSERGASMVEYALLAIFIAIIAFTAVQMLGQEVSSTYSQAADGFSAN